MLRTRNPERTRRELVESALDEIRRKGYQATSVNDILARTGLTRGALYHHFHGKHELGLAVLDEVDRVVVDPWLEPLRDADDPLTTLQQSLVAAGEKMDLDEVELGCPLNNLTQELSAVDEEFRQRLAAIVDRWRMGIADGLRRGQARGTVHPAVDPLHAATFFVATLAGARGLAKTTRSADLLQACGYGLIRYLDTLRAE